MTSKQSARAAVEHLKASPLYSSRLTIHQRVPSSNTSACLQGLRLVDVHYDVAASCRMRTLDDQAFRSSIHEHVFGALGKLAYTDDVQLMDKAATAASCALFEEDVVGYACRFIDLAHEVCIPLDLIPECRYYWSVLFVAVIGRMPLPPQGAASMCVRLCAGSAA